MVFRNSLHLVVNSIQWIFFCCCKIHSGYILRLFLFKNLCVNKWIAQIKLLRYFFCESPLSIHHNFLHIFKWIVTHFIATNGIFRNFTSNSVDDNHQKYQVKHPHPNCTLRTDESVNFPKEFYQIVDWISVKNFAFRQLENNNKIENSWFKWFKWVMRNKFVELKLK